MEKQVEVLEAERKDLLSENIRITEESHTLVSSGIASSTKGYWHGVGLNVDLSVVVSRYIMVRFSSNFTRLSPLLNLEILKTMPIVIQILWLSSVFILFLSSRKAIICRYFVFHYHVPCCWGNGLESRIILFLLWCSFMLIGWRLLIDCTQTLQKHGSVLLYTADITFNLVLCSDWFQIYHRLYVNNSFIFRMRICENNSLACIMSFTRQ